jgi:hypothetical protein
VLLVIILVVVVVELVQGIQQVLVETVVVAPDQTATL